MIVGLAAIGCCPTIRKDIEGEECSEEINYWAAKYNDGLKTMLQNFKSELKDINYSYFDTYSISTNVIKNPASYGTSNKHRYIYIYITSSSTSFRRSYRNCFV